MLYFLDSTHVSLNCYGGDYLAAMKFQMPDFQRLHFSLILKQYELVFTSLLISILVTLFPAARAAVGKVLCRRVKTENTENITVVQTVNVNE